MAEPDNNLPAPNPAAEAVRKTTEALVKVDEGRHLAALLQPYSAIALASLFDRHGWSADQEIKILTEIATGGEKDSSRLGAIRLLQELRRDALEQSGLLRTVRRTETTTEDGVKRTDSITATGLAVPAEIIDRLYDQADELTDELTNEEEPK